MPSRPASCRGNWRARWLPSGTLLLIAPHEWEVHQAPHDYFRYTRHGLEYLLAKAGFAEIEIEPVGGYFRLLSRRLMNGLQFFSGGVKWLCFLPAAVFLVPPALVLPFLDFLDRDRNFTLGYICIARKIGVLMLLARTVSHSAFARRISTESARWSTRAKPWNSDRGRPDRPAIHKLQAYILAQLKLRKCTVTQDDFTAQTPAGPVAMKNIIARFAGTSGRAIVLTGHYDTKVLPGFVGANDGGSSAGFLLEMADVLDGAVAQGRSSTWYGSTARRLTKSGPPPTASTAAATWRRNGRRRDSWGASRR